MNAIAIWKAITLLLSMTAVALAAYLLEQQPQGVWIWLAGALTIPVFWTGLAVSGALNPERPATKRLQLYRALGKAAVPICLALATLTWNEVGGSSPEALAFVGDWMVGF